jgi:hypothetical protein
MVEVIPTGAGPSARPKSNRRISKITAVVVKPIKKVTIEKPKIAHDTIFRVPVFAMIRPAGICEIAYPRKKKLEMAPCCVLDMWNSSPMKGNKVPMFERSAMQIT